MKMFRRVTATLLLAALGCYVLWLSRTGWGLLIGVSLEFLSCAIGFPTELRGAIAELKDDAEVVLPVVLEATGRARRRPEP
jgi:hypothetical protein